MDCCMVVVRGSIGRPAVRKCSQDLEETSTTGVCCFTRIAAANGDVCQAQVKEISSSLISLRALNFDHESFLIYP